MFFEDNNFKNFDFNIIELADLGYPSKSFNHYENLNNSKFVDSKEALLRGNIIANEYEPYKNYPLFPLVPKDEKEALLFKVYEYDFVVNDLNLYLDLNPQDMHAYELFKTYSQKYEEVKIEYERKYGPLTLTSTDYSSYQWDNDPWPWENDGGSKYV